MMAKNKPPTAFSPEDMKRRRSRSIAIALALVALVIIIFITFLLKMSGVH
jgi:hypothetical protein